MAGWRPSLRSVTPAPHLGHASCSGHCVSARGTSLSQRQEGYDKSAEGVDTDNNGGGAASDRKQARERVHASLEADSGRIMDRGVGVSPNAVEEPFEDPFGVAKILMSMSVHTLGGKIDKIARGLEALKTWVQTLVDGIEERVTNAFASQQDMIGKVEDRVDKVEDKMEEMQKTNKRNIDALEKPSRSTTGTSSSSK